MAAGFQSLARGAGRHFGGGNVRQTIVEMDHAFLFVTAAGEGSCLAVLSPASADAGLVAYEMAILVKRVGEHLSVTPGRVTAGQARSDPACRRPTIRWLDGEAGPVVRPYALTGGRTRASGETLDLIAIITAVRGAQLRSGVPGPRAPRRCCGCAGCPTSVADLAADLDLPLGVVRILLGDLRERALVAIHHPIPPAG